MRVFEQALLERIVRRRTFVAEHAGDQAHDRIDEYERLKEQEYDDSTWTREELQALAWEVGERAGWEEYDDAAEKP